MPAPTTSPLTAAEIARTETGSFDFQLRFYVGGQRGYIPEGDIWSRDFDDTHSGVTDFTASSTIDGAIDYDDTSLTLADATDFLSASSNAPRTVFIKPYSATYTWERVTYTDKSGNVLSGLTRRNVIWPPAAYSHPDGATVYQWVDVTDRIVPDFDVVWARRGNTASWEIQLTGIGYIRELFDRGNSLIIQARFDVTNTGSWTSWITWFAGYIDETPNVMYDKDDGRLFQFVVRPLDSFLFDVPAHHIGKHDIAKNKPTTVSSYLLSPTLEAAGEYIPSSQVDGSRAVDDDYSTPWVSQGAPLSVDESFEPLDTQRHLYISEVYFQHDTLGDEYIWVEIHNPRDSATSAGLNWLTNKQTVFADDPPSAGAVPWPVDYFIMLPHVDIPAKGYLVLCKSLTHFEQQWTVVEAQTAGPYDWRRMATDENPYGRGDHANQVTFDKTGDFLQLRGAVRNGGVIDMIVWGNYPTSTVPLQENDGALLFTGDPFNWPDRIPGNKSIRRIHNASGGGGYESVTAADWQFAPFPTPGSRKSYFYGEWISVDVGFIPTKLDRELLTTDTVVYVTNDTVAFPPSGSIVVGTDVLAYTSKDSEKFNITDAPSQDWPEGTPVLPYVNGAATQYYPVNVIGWERPYGKPYPKDFEVWASRESSPTYPQAPDEIPDGGTPDERWKDDWEQLVQRVSWEEIDDNGLSKWTHTFLSAKRFRHYMWIVHEMSDAGRVKIGELSVIADASTHADSDENSHNLDGSTILDVATHYVVDHFGLDEDKVTSPATPEDQMVVINNLDLQKGDLWDVLDSLMRLTGYFMLVNPAYGIRFRLDPLFPYGSVDPIQYEFDRDTIESPLRLTVPRKNLASQVHLRARDLSSGVNYNAYWPTTANRYGQVQRVDNMQLGGQNHANAFARNLFRRANFISTVTLRPWGICEWVTPAQRIAVVWDEDEDQGPFLQRREYVVVGVQWQVRASDPLAKSWICELNCEEYAGW